MRGPNLIDSIGMALETSRQKPEVSVIYRGVEVLAKSYMGEIIPLTYANRTQAQRKAEISGSNWTVYRFGRPFYVGKSA